MPGYSKLVTRVEGLKIITVLSTICGAGVVFTGLSSPSLVSASGFAFPVLGAGFSVLVVSFGLMFIATSKTRDRYRLGERNLASAFILADSNALQKAVEDLELVAKADRLFAQRLAMDLPELRTRLNLLKDAETKKRGEKEVRSCFSKLRASFVERTDNLRDGSPVLHARAVMIRGIEQAKERRARLERDVEAHILKLSWWEKLNFDFPDYNKMDCEIEKLKRQVNGFLRANASEIEAAETRIQILQERAEERLAGAERAALTAVPEDRNATFDSNPIAMNALVLAALSVPVSAWNDLASAGKVYDALRSVNGNYASLTDAEIWLQTFLLEPEQLAGLLSLTKGALFEAYVADSTGGVLHEHFNTPETDIVIDGTEYQIKATDSAAYISTVDEGIPVIATSEVAETTEAFDGGITDAELERVSELALGGSVIDLNDTAIDAVVSGFGGLYSRENFKLNRAAALAEWRELGAG